jgi:2-keto-4-pentenoate hydratase/2-oxohepta-3-ene-1,7-dioic acid hydratase in catechol pathway
LLALPPGDHSVPWLADLPLEEEQSLASLRLLAPVTPSKVVAIGRNYAAHAAELGNEVPERPLIFLKAPSSIVGPGESILLPPDSARVEHEAELAVVIGRRCRHVQPSDALSYVAGYTVLNDVTARDLQRADGQFARAKGFDTFCPIGPWVETNLDPSNLRVWCSVRRAGGEAELRQDGRTPQMVFDVRTLVAAVSRVMTLQAGDVIATGTPEGVGLLRDGDEVVVGVDGIGALLNPVVCDPDAPEIHPSV